MDDIKYSRQRYVLGKGAMQKLSCASVYLRGFGAVGVEIAKNLILTGVEKLTIHDSKISSKADEKFNFFLDKSAVNKINRVVGSLKEMTEMNPNVQIDVVTTDIIGYAALTKFQCVIVTETPFEEQIGINEFCRKQIPPIKFISTDCFGALTYCFCDFGTQHIVYDSDGEEPKELLIAQINKEEDFVAINLFENQRPNIDVGDFISFSNTISANCLNRNTHSVIGVTSTSLSISHGHDGDCFTSLSGGTCRKEKRPFTVEFESLANQINCPTFVEANEDNFTCHLAVLSLHQYIQNYQTLPKQRDHHDLKTFQELNTDVAKCLQMKGVFNWRLLNTIGSTAAGLLTPLAAFIGGVVAQEVIKAVTNKYIPINQWFYYNTFDVVMEKENASFNQETEDNVNTILSTQLMDSLNSSKIFLVGCGAIGCEVLKNLALLNVGVLNEVTITDNDHVEKSNLTRQFLFRNRSIQKSKSIAAAEAVKRFCPNMNIRPLNLKVCTDTQEFFNDQFFKDKDIVVGGLDNIEARQYLDRRCVDTCRPYLESGTFGTKGHVQVILPHSTESYASQSDPVDDEIPYCTLKSFPSTINHTIQWARDKFDSLFFNKPNLVMKFENTRNVWMDYIKKLDSGCQLGDEERNTMTNVIGWLSQSLKHVPSDWSQCLLMARLKFEKYFNHKAKQLLHKFPSDTKLEDGGLFWHPPRNPPKPIDFDIENSLHYLYIISTAKLFAATWQISSLTWDISKEYVAKIFSSFAVPEFIPNNSKLYISLLSILTSPCDIFHEIEIFDTWHHWNELHISHQFPILCVIIHGIAA